MSKTGMKLMLAALLAALVLLSGCGREKPSGGALIMQTQAPGTLATAAPGAGSQATAVPGAGQQATAVPGQQAAAVPGSGSLTIEAPDATAAPVRDEGAAQGTRTEARSLDPSGKMIALTFDDGPGPGTRRILSALDEVGGRATFCMVANRLDDYAPEARAVAAQGSEIATHTWDHSNLTKLSAGGVREELCRSMDAIEAATGVRPAVLRPPYGSVNAEVKQACGELGLVIANWNIDPEDWKVRDAGSVCDHVLRHAKDGGIVVCHDLYPETASAMEAAIRELSAQGYQLVTVSELLNARSDGGTAGKVYYAA